MSVNLAHKTKFDLLYSNDGGLLGNNFVDSLGNKVSLPKSQDKNSTWNYKEVKVLLATAEGSLNVSYFEQISLSSKSCTFHVISPQEFFGATYKDKSVDEARIAFLNRLSSIIERLWGSVACNAK